MKVTERQALDVAPALCERVECVKPPIQHSSSSDLQPCHIMQICLMGSNLTNATLCKLGQTRQPVQQTPRNP